MTLLKLQPAGCSGDQATLFGRQPQGANTYSQFVHQHGHIDIGGFMHRLNDPEGLMGTTDCR
jgi:hypothetical protein